MTSLFFAFFCSLGWWIGGGFSLEPEMLIVFFASWLGHRTGRTTSL